MKRPLETVCSIGSDEQGYTKGLVFETRFEIFLEKIRQILSFQNRNAKLYIFWNSKHLIGLDTLFKMLETTS